MPFHQPELEHGQLWLIEQVTVRAGMVREAQEYVILIHHPPLDWKDKTYKNMQHFIRTSLKFGDRNQLNYDIMDNMRWLHTNVPKNRPQWTFNLWKQDKDQLKYKKRIYTWR